MTKLTLTVEHFVGASAAHLMPITEVKWGNMLLFMPNQHQELAAIDSLNPKAVLGTVLSTPQKGEDDYYSLKTDLHDSPYRHHINDLVAIVQDWLTIPEREKVTQLLCTSADDCKISLNYVTDTNVITEGLRLAIAFGYTTKAGHFQRRLNRLAKGK